MDPSRIRRQTVAIIAAYAMAMQALLSALVPVVPMALADSLAVLCAHDAGGSDGSGSPAQHDLPCAAICAAIGHGIAGPAPPEPAVAIARLQIVVAPPAPTQWEPPSLLIRGPQAARGPPLA